MSKRPSRSPSKPSGAPVGSRLDRIPLLNILSGKERERILHDLTESHYSKDEFIFREGDPAEYFHIVKEGTVKCITNSPGGKECALKMLLPGDLFCCDAAAFDGACHPGSAQPMGDASILRLKKKTYFDLLRRNSDAATKSSSTSVIGYVSPKKKPSCLLWAGRTSALQPSSSTLLLAAAYKNLKASDSWCESPEKTWPTWSASQRKPRSGS